MLKIGRRLAGALVAAAAFAAPVAGAYAQTTLKVALHSDLKIVDPVWTTALISTHHGYMIYDTLFALDEKLEVKPQMVDKWEVSPDKLTWTFTLRDGLEWHDGKPVTAEDCVASIKRWGAKDSMGQKLLGVVTELSAPDAKTIKMVLKQPYGLVLESLGKSSSNVPFMMPKAVAGGDANTQITESIGSGPFIFKKDEWKAGEKAVYVKNPKYKPRNEPASGLAGGKVAKVDRVEWITIPDQQTQVNALLGGEVDLVEIVPPDLLPLLAKDKNIKITVVNKAGRQYSMRFNVLFKPFDNVKVRQAILYGLSQKEVLEANVGNPEYYRECRSLFPCGSPLESTKGWDDKLARQRRQGQGDAGGVGLRRHAGDLPAPDRHRGPQQPRHGGQGPAREDRAEGRSAADGLADPGVAPRQEGRAGQGRLGRLLHLVGRHRRLKPGVGRVRQRLVRQGDLRLAVRRDDREAARRLRLGSRSGQAEGDRRAGPAARAGISDARAARPVHHADGDPHQRQRALSTPSLALWNIEKK